MGTKSIYTKQEKQIVLACFRAGLSATAVSTKLGFPIQTVKNWRAWTGPKYHRTASIT